MHLHYMIHDCLGLQYRLELWYYSYEDVLEPVFTHYYLIIAILFQLHFLFLCIYKKHNFFKQFSAKNIITACLPTHHYSADDIFWSYFDSLLVILK